MEQLPNVGRVFHARMVAMLTVLALADIALLIYAAESVLLEGPSVMLMFASEYLILLATLWATTIKYILNVIDLRSEEPWEGKSMKVLYVDIITGVSGDASSVLIVCRLPQARHLHCLLRAHPHLLRLPAQHVPRRLHDRALVHDPDPRPHALSRGDARHGPALPERVGDRDAGHVRSDVHHLPRGHGRTRRRGRTARARRSTRSRRSASTGARTAAAAHHDRQHDAEEAALWPRLPLQLPTQLARAATELPDVVRRSRSVIPYDTRSRRSVLQPGATPRPNVGAVPGLRRGAQAAAQNRPVDANALAALRQFAGLPPLPGFGAPAAAPAPAPAPAAGAAAPAGAAPAPEAHAAPAPAPAPAAPGALDPTALHALTSSAFGISTAGATTLQVIDPTTFVPPSTIRLAVNPLVQFRMPPHPGLPDPVTPDLSRPSHHRARSDTPPFSYSAAGPSTSMSRSPADLPHHRSSSEERPMTYRPPSPMAAPPFGSTSPPMLGSAWRAVNGNGSVDKGKRPERPEATAGSSASAGLPRLIPLFDTAETDRAAPLSEEDLAALGKTTREAFEARLRLLERIDADLARTTDDVRRALRQFGGGDDAGPGTGEEGSVDPA